MSRSTAAFKAPSRHPRGYGGDMGARKRPPTARKPWAGATPDRIEAAERRRTGTTRQAALDASNRRPSRKLRPANRTALLRDARS